MTPQLGRLLLVAVFLVLAFAKQDDLSVRENPTSCTIPNESTEGVCVEPSKCPAFQNITAGQQLGETGRLSFVRVLQCDSANRTLICCPRSGAAYVKPELSLDVPRRDRNATFSVGARFGGEPEKCGEPAEQDRIFGEMTNIDEFPWAALLFYREDYQGCGGVLISSRFVLTAAHCLAGNNYDKYGPLEYVRLGEYNTFSHPDCLVLVEGQLADCNEAKIDVQPQSIKVHPDYVPNSSQQRHDIGLIELDQEVSFTDFLSPICLPESRFQSVPAKRQTYSVCGWGRTSLFNNEHGGKSPIKMKASLPYLKPQDCDVTYRSERISLGPGQLCAGGNLGQDSCAGDSGSPLMFYDRWKSVWVLSGLVSRGPVNCGEANKPGIYTNVKQYLPWIKANTGL